ncbi:MAG: 2-C-methyl-D-erythritol 4-phosphate cytidylyltransferase [Salinivirgaceae bacterium]|jgi:2-C-methyl-D-erythritol 4-phosphate cytidylyltransferase|nr:2-C-methyl-D-erythritol 4-phosphate cytidylyltransferase [Salinivirgaceae bacterium]
MNHKQKYAIIVAGGSGKRMGNEVPKQFLEVAGLPILMHTINCFFSFDSEIKIVVVLPASQHSYWNKLIEKHSFSIQHQVTKGGIERFYSVLAGLKFTDSDSLIAIHDGVRPLVSKKTLENCFATAISKGSAIPVVPATESIRKVHNDVNKAVNRSHYFMVQTPQIFQAEILINAYKQEYDCTFTDDASVVEKAGNPIHLVEGNVENIKITRPIDLKIAEILLQK